MLRRRKEQEDGWPSPYSLMVLPMSSPRNKDRKQQQGEDGERGSLDGKSTRASWNIALILHDFMCFVCVCEGGVYLSIIANDGTWADLMLLFMLCLISAVLPADIALMTLWMVKDKTSTPNVHMLENTSLHVQ